MEEDEEEEDGAFESLIDCTSPCGTSTTAWREGGKEAQKRVKKKTEKE